MHRDKPLNGVPTAAESGGILKEMRLMQTRIGTLAFPLDYMIENGAPASLITQHMETTNRMLAEAVAKIIGGSAEEIADKNKRTPEQDRLMMELSIRGQLARLEKFRKSNYALTEIMVENRYKDDTAKKPDSVTDDEETALHLITLYFFVTHKYLDPRESGGIGEAETAELYDLIDKVIEIRSNRPRLSLTQAIRESIGVKIDSRSRLSSKIPKKHVMPNNKLTNALTTNSLAKSIIDTGSYELVVAGKGKKAITTVCILTYEGDDVKLTGRQPFTEYDRNVNNAVTSLYVYGDKSHAVTPATVYRAMVNMTETETPSEQQIEAVTRSMDKQRFIRARGDCTAELMRRGASVDGEQITSGKFDTYLLPADVIEVEAGGRTVRGYRIMQEPILYGYSKITGQVLTIPAGLLDIQADGQRVKNTEQRIAIKGYLLRRIEIMNGKTAKRQSRNILFDAIYEASGVEIPNDKEKERIRNYTFIALDYWKGQGYITGYERLRNGTTYTGIAIDEDIPTK